MSRPEKANTPPMAPNSAHATQATGEVAFSRKIVDMYWGLWKTKSAAVAKRGSTSSSHAHGAERGPQLAGASARPVNLHCPDRFAMFPLSAQPVSHTGCPPGDPGR